MLRRVMLALVVGCCSSGCVGVCSFYPTDLVVTRAGTGEPAAGVPVRVTYPQWWMVNRPESICRTTDEDGKVTLPMAALDPGFTLEAGTTQYWVDCKELFAGSRPLNQVSAQTAHDYSVRLVSRGR